jgi:hypothetical protein
MWDDSTASRWHPVLLTTHLLTAAGWLGAGLAVTLLGVAGLAGTDPVAVYPAARLLAVWLIAPLAGLALVSGLLLTASTSWSVSTDRWVTAKLTITLLLSAAVTVLLIPRLGAVAGLVTRPDPAMVTTVERLPLALAPAAASALLAINVVLAVLKPGGKHRHSHASRSPGADRR